MSERAVAIGLITLCFAYLSWVAWSAHLALDPQVTTRGLWRALPPPRVFELHEGAETLLDDRRGSLPELLSRRYRLDQAQVERALNEPEPLEGLARWLRGQRLSVELGPLKEDTPLPALLFQAQGAHRGGRLLIARYAGGWVRYEPARGVLLGPLPSGWLGAPCLTSPALDEARW